MIRYEVYLWIVEIISKVPGKIGLKIRAASYAKLCKCFGKGVEIRENVTIAHYKNLSIGSFSGITARGLAGARLLRRRAARPAA